MAANVTSYCNHRCGVKSAMFPCSYIKLGKSAFVDTRIGYMYVTTSLNHYSVGEIFLILASSAVLFHYKSDTQTSSVILFVEDRMLNLYREVQGNIKQGKVC